MGERGLGEGDEGEAEDDHECVGDPGGAVNTFEGEGVVEKEEEGEGEEYGKGSGNVVMEDGPAIDGGGNDGECAHQHEAFVGGWFAAVEQTPSDENGKQD